MVLLVQKHHMEFLFRALLGKPGKVPFTERESGGPGGGRRSGLI